MSRFVQLICLLIFLVPHHIHSQQEETTEAKAPSSDEPVDAKNDVQERKSVEDRKRDSLKLGVGAVLSPDTGPWLIQSAGDYNLKSGRGTITYEGNFLSHSESVLGSTLETLMMGVNVMYSTRNQASGDWYLFGGVGYAWTSTDVRFDTSLIETVESSDINYAAGVGYDISNRLYIEARWDHLNADLMVIAGFRYWLGRVR